MLYIYTVYIHFPKGELLPNFALIFRTVPQANGQFSPPAWWLAFEAAMGDAEEAVTAASWSFIPIKSGKKSVLNPGEKIFLN